MDPPSLKTEQTLELTFEIFRFHEFWDFVAQKTQNFQNVTDPDPKYPTNFQI